MGQYYKAVLISARNKRKGFRTINAISSYEFDNGAKLMEHSYVGNKYVLAAERYIFNKPTSVTWAGDYSDCGLFDVECNVSAAKVSLLPQLPEGKPLYFVNLTKNEYIQRPDRGNFVINPFPILTSNGNGRGGGDYLGSNMEYVGWWCHDIILLTDNIEKFEEFENLDVEFKEDR